MALLTKPSTRLARLATATILAFAGSGYAVAPAHTQEQTLVAPRHTAVLSIVPADGAVLDRAPREIVLTFNEKISPQYAQLILSRDGTALSIAEPVVTGEVIRVPLAETATGDYRLAFRVVSADGHPISGESHYTVRGAVATPSTTTSAATTSAATTPTPPGTVTSPPSAAAAGTRQPTESQANHLPGILIGGGLVAVAVALLWWDRRRRQASPGG